MQFRGVLHRLTLHAQTHSVNAEPSRFARILRPFVHLAAELTTAWYDSQPYGDPGFVPEPHDAVSDERLEKSAQWAQTQVSPAERLRGVAARAVYDASRNTVVYNVNREPDAKWAREARPDACSFCRVLSTAGSKYRSAESALSVVGRTPKRGDDGRGALRGTRDYGESYHDNCHCIAVMIRKGEKYIPPAYADGWILDYTRAIDDAKAHIGTRPAFKDILNAMDRARRAAEREPAGN